MKREYIVPIDFVGDIPPDNDEIVRCKDCKHSNHIVCATKGEVMIYRVFCTKPYVERGNATHEPDWFCADGERRVQDAAK